MLKLSNGYSIFFLFVPWRVRKGKIMEKHQAMKWRPKEIRPYERYLSDGPSVLNDAELLAVILRTGSVGESSIELATRILSLDGNKNGLLGLLRLTIPELMSIKGIGTVKAVQLQCVCELSRRISKSMAYEGISMNNPQAIAEYYMEDLRHQGQEQLMLLMLNTKNKLIKDVIISKGTVNASLISPREIFVESLRYQAVYIILLHNHPSGDPSPSLEDIRITRRMKEAGDILGITLLDHIIIGDNAYISLKERGIL